jgi:hypothetical protein
MKKNIDLSQFGFKGFSTGPARTASTDANEVDLTIVIAHRGPAMGLWATIHSCEIELAGSGLMYNYVLVPNGEEKFHIDEERVWHFLEKSGKVRDLLKFAQPLSPPNARNEGAAMANGKYIFFFDNHCLVAKNYFTRAISTMETHGCDLLHSMTRFYAGEEDHWHYKLTLAKDFWGNSNTAPTGQNPYGVEPYRCAVAGHGGFAVTRKAWREFGGYWPGFVGYGGEEVFLDLGFWLTGKSVWLDPQMVHYHFAGVRPYARHYTDDYFRNMMMCSNIIGGYDWMMKVHDSFLKYTRMKSDKTMLDLAMEAHDKSAHFAAQFAARRTKSLDEQLVCFGTNNIPH